jgi:hypothetical protein
MPSSPRWLPLLLVVVAGPAWTASEAQAQGWDYGRQMFGFAQYSASTGWSSYYHPGDGRRGVYYVDAGHGNYYGDPKARPLVPSGSDYRRPQQGHHPARRRHFGRRR